MKQPTICTIITKTYLAHARSLTESFLEHNPSGRVFVLLVDVVNDYFDPAQEKFTLVPVAELEIQELPDMAMRYSVTELCTAVKPFFLEYLIKKYDLDMLCYFDPDIYFYQPLTEIWNLLSEHSVVVTPHLLGPLEEEEKTPNEWWFLRAGAYNLGFIGIRRTPEVMRYLQWWQRRLIFYAHCQPEKFQHFDQKWIDLLPGFIDVFVSRHPGHNAGFWDLANRHITQNSPTYKANDELLIFFHFSGYQPEKPTEISRHQNRFQLAELPALKSLFHRYQNRLLANNYFEIKHWPYELAQAITNATAVPHTATKTSQKIRKKVKRIVYNIGPMIYGLAVVAATRLGLAREIVNLLGDDRVRNIRAFFFKIRVVPRLKIPVTQKPFGVNVIGYTRHTSGVGQAARSSIQALHNYGLPTAWLPADNQTEHPVESWLAVIPTGNPYSINLAFVNADVIADRYEDLEDKLQPARYNIGYWQWELENFPSQWKRCFEYFDEIWVASSFVQHALQPHAPVPVLVMPIPIDRQPSPGISRKKLGLPEEKFIVLTVCDLGHYPERKNLLAAIDAYREAFGKNSTEAVLVVKVIHAEMQPIYRALVRQAVQSVSGILIEDMMHHTEIDNLYHVSDIYLSLHRAEGFGLTMAEAMRLGKPVIATNYGGNTDYMNVQNSFPVRHTMVAIEQDIGPYRAGESWADPDITHAAEQLRYVFEHPTEATRRGQQAARDIQRRYEPRIAATRISERLRAIWESIK